MLILPVIIPSWRFFNAIEPSPRVQWATLNSDGTVTGEWQDARPRPAHVSVSQMIRRLFWNPHWNETLYLVSCAERTAQAPTDHSIQEIRRRIAPEVALARTGAAAFCFRLVFVQRGEADLSQELVFTSDRFPIAREDRG